MRGPEGKFQDEVVAWLRSQGCKVIKNDPLLGRQKGIPDLLALKGGFWLMLECKASKNAPKQAGQQDWIDWCADNSYGAFVWPGERWKEVKAELKEMLRD